MGRKMKDTSPEAVASRSKYAKTIASLYPILKASVPKSFKGYAQGDLLWVGTPKISDGAFEFKPNKVLYRVDAGSDLGGRIAGSRVGMVIHSVFASQQDEEPDALRDVSQLGFNEDHGLVIVPHEIELKQTLKLNSATKKAAEKIISSQGKAISTFMDPLSLTDRNIKALPGLMKSFLAYKAGEGSNDFSRVGEEFLTWLASGSSKASAKMQAGVLEWIQANLDGYNAVWYVVKLLVDLKLDLKAQIDRQVGDVVYAELDNKPGHEGFVSVTPDGIIKLVHRAEFMKKTKLDEQTLQEQDASSAVFTFMRANPPTRGHHMVVDKVAQAAKGGDYFIFLSQSQDAKKNPLDWQTKMHFAKLLMPRHRAHFASGNEFANIKTPLLAADWLYNQGYRDLTMVVGSDRVSSMKDILDGWNSEDIRTKYGRDPVNIRVLSAGHRDPDAEGVAGISASMVRELAKNSDFEGFKDVVGLDDASAFAMYDAVRKGMKVGKSKAKEPDDVQPLVNESLSNKCLGNRLSESAPADHSAGTIVKLKMSDASAHKLVDWCDHHQVPCMAPYELHLTVLFSKKPVPHLQALDGKQINIKCKPVGWKQLGASALTLELDCPAALRLHQKLLDQGGSHSFPNFIAHTSVNYDWHTQELPDDCPDFYLVFDAIEVDAIDPDYKPSSE
jgi:hypothetical protein